MDQSRYWIPKERTCLNSHVLSSFGDSWEEQAFAEDAAGPLGGCIWPPRSYTCSFCRREFRSAQALGGHMNVHRRDRARLKQTPSSNQVVEPNNTSLGRCLVQNPNEICNPNFDLDNIALFSSSSSLRPSTPPFTCSFIQEKQKSTPILSWSKLETQKRLHIADMGNQEKSYIKSNNTCSNKDSTCILQNSQNTTGPKKDSTYILQNTQNTTGSRKDSTYILQDSHQIEVHFAGNLNTRVRGRCDTPIYNDKNEGNDGLIFKRRRIDDDERYLFLKTSNLINGDEAESIKSLKSSPNSTLENLDLELRLGDRP